MDFLLDGMGGGEGGRDKDLELPGEVTLSDLVWSRIH